jgi:hypothetical protein
VLHDVRETARIIDVLAPKDQTSADVSGLVGREVYSQSIAQDESRVGGGSRRWSGYASGDTVLSRSWWRIGSGVISGLKFSKPIRRLAAAEGDNANVDRYIKRVGS